MMNFNSFRKKLEHLFLMMKKLKHLCKSWCNKPSGFYTSSTCAIQSSFHFLASQAHPFWIQLTYFVILSLIGHLALKVSKSRITGSSLSPLDIFFTSVSSSTVSSMSTVEMEVFSNTQLIIMTILMALGGEIFTSMLGLYLSSKSKFPNDHHQTKENGVIPSNNIYPRPEKGLEVEKSNIDPETNTNYLYNEDSSKFSSIKCLAYVVLGYYLMFLLIGSCLIAMYTSLVSSAREILANKGIEIQTFSVFTTVSTFANCGFVPTNENMIVFKKNSGLLLILIPQILFGNTLFAPCLRFLIWVLEKITRRAEFRYMLMNTREMGYPHLLSFAHSCLLVGTLLGFIALQFIAFCLMEWNSEGMDGLNSYQKFMGALFVVVNSRHAGESIIDLSIISPAILVLFVVMMYFPPYTSFLPIKQHQDIVSGTREKCKNEWKSLVQCLIFSPTSYISMFVILICVVEREKMKKDPLNFNVLNITLEVVSAYGNVGFSTGYSCKRQIEPDGWCKDALYGFVGRWSNMGKFILILVMFFGRLKKFTINGGKAWKLS